MTYLFAKLFYGSRYAASGVNVIILEHSAVGKIKTVVFASAAGYRVFLKGAQRRKGLSCVGYRSLCSLTEFYCLCGRRGYSRHMLQQV